ncbi:hypothetical protein [Pseudomonas sp. UBA6323]|uniref:hypothetical protein n=1 Tax=Pseudomonas sp. UBA6323 TaxID=1947329 RepID=UPI0025E2281B|nr:hypothetical protein [Pseudomonas sp. UBA6323]
MSKLCQGLGHLSREEARKLFDQRVRDRTASLTANSGGLSASTREPLDSDWMDNLDQADWECLMGGPDESLLESLYD